MKMENDKSLASAAEFAHEKQQMIDGEKAALREIVSAAFAPLEAKAHAAVSMLSVAEKLEPVAPLASQPVWQAGEPLVINVDYDVPSFGAKEEMAQLAKAARMESSLSMQR